jgi:hypothetical protein
MCIEKLWKDEQETGDDEAILFGQVSLKDPNVKGLVASVYY